MVFEKIGLKHDMIKAIFANLDVSKKKLKKCNSTKLVLFQQNRHFAWIFSLSRIQNNILKTMYARNHIRSTFVFEIKDVF